ncbi:hypothetical protein [Actinomyces ruminis]|uniref:DUF2339 domain-containing protein n=1 Tax=Actinomyces ruminis TaxID=1937003 RepID=A0ABX4M975_9ACTO|nr:hypothetical protein [Actinomyces ruminis]PHP51989.1 hypothetical protein BW737_012820 [Actinomyces ruminis]
MVLLAAVSLIALAWDQISDAWKVIGLALLSLAMVSAGTTLAENRPRQQIAAAAITGTGGALGFVTIIGAVLLVDLQTSVAIALMAAWGFVLLLVSWTAGQFFTAVVSALGALVTVGFAWVQANAYPGRAALIWALVNGYLVALAVVSALLAHYAQRMRLAAWLPATAMVVTAVAWCSVRPCCCALRRDRRRPAVPARRGATASGASLRAAAVPRGRTQRRRLGVGRGRRDHDPRGAAPRAGSHDPAGDS